MSELFIQKEKEYIEKMLADMADAYKQHNINSLICYKQVLFGHIGDLIARKIAEQQIEEVLDRMIEERNKKGISNE